MKKKILIPLEQFVRQQSLISRRELLQLITSKKVKINQKIISNLQTEIDPKNDKVMINGKLITADYGNIYIKYHKKRGVLSTMEDPKGRPCVGDIIKALDLPLFPVGRLDRDTTGLLILTNDGDFAHRLSHPSFECNKYYQVKLDKRLSKKDKDRLCAGIILEDGPTAFKSIEGDDKTFFVTISEGRNRIVRRSFDLLGYQVKQLHRTGIANINVEPLKVGELAIFNTADLKNFQLKGTKVNLKRVKFT